MLYLYLCLLGVSFLLIEFLIGGTRLVFGLPPYAVLSLAALASVFSLRRLPVPANFRCLISTALFFGYVLIRIVFSPVEYLARFDLLAVLAALMVYFLVALHLTAPKYRWWLAGLLMTIGLVHVLVGTIDYFSGGRFSLLRFIQPGEFGLRASGLYICPNSLAGFLEITVLFGLSLVCWSRRGYMTKLLAGYASLAGVVGLLLTGSRGGYLSLICGLLTFAVLSLMAIKKARRERFWLATSSVVVGGALMMGAAVYFVVQQYPLQNRASMLLSGKEQTNIRLDLWKIALEQFKLSPVMGTGSGTYLYHARELRPPDIVADPVYAHNDYLQFLAEFGAVGAATLLIFLFTHLSCGWKSLMWSVGQRGVALGRLRSDSLALNIAAFCAVVTYMVHSVVDFNLHVPANAMLLAFVFAILANPGVVLPFKEAQHLKPSRYAALALPALAVWMTFAGLRTWPAEYYSEQARVALRDEKYVDSIRFARQGINWDSTNPDLYLDLGQAHAGYAEIAPSPHAATNSWNAAVQAFRKGLRYFPRDLWLLLGLGEALDALKQFDEAEPVFQQTLRWNPKSAPVHARYATHLRLAGRLDEAEEEYKRSLALHWTYEAKVGLEQLAKDRQARAQ